MIRLSKLSDYAAVVLSKLAQERGNVVSASDLAMTTLIPEPTVSKVLKLLVRGGLIVSVRGAAGGYRMEREAGQISLKEFITALEGPIAVTSCLGDGESECSITHTCPMKGRWHKVNTVIMNTLDDMPLTEILQPVSLSAIRSEANGRGINA